MSFLKIRSRLTLLISGIIFGIAASFFYAFFGFYYYIIFLLAASLLLLSRYFFLKKERIDEYLSRFGRKDVAALLFLIIIFAPIYLYKTYTIPLQVNTDEITIMFFEKEVVNQASPDPFGLSNYYGLPSFAFLTYGSLGRIIGGITLAHMRLINGFIGILIVIMSYLFFRESFSRLPAFLGAALVGSNHALIAISRMAMRDTSGLLIELIAFTLLLAGLKRHSRFLTFLGGAIAGLSFYIYYPARIILPLWLLGLVAMLFFTRKIITRVQIIEYGAICLLGFIIIATPLFIATIKTPTALNYQREQFLFLPEGQKLEMRWIGTATPSLAIKKNIVNGLTTFNKPLHDQGYIYPNYGHGFVDPLTGALIWLGVVTILIRVIRKKALPADLIAISSFLALWLIFAFLITKAPNYTRLLIFLPFVAYLVVRGVEGVVILVARLFKKILSDFLHIMKPTLLIGSTIFIFLSNLFIFNDFVAKGVAEGNDVGSTARYVEARASIPDYAFYLVADKNHPYYSWGESSQWQTWLGFFVPPHQESKIISPNESPLLIGNPPFTIFTSEEVWRDWEPSLRSRYSNLTTAKILQNGSRIAIEVQ